MSPRIGLSEEIVAWAVDHLSGGGATLHCGDGSLRIRTFWTRQIGALDHKVRLVTPAYVKPFVKQQKNDAADAEAIAEAASRPPMRFVEPKTERQQARAMVCRAHEMFVWQRTQ